MLSTIETLILSIQNYGGITIMGIKGHSYTAYKNVSWLVAGLVVRVMEIL